jgi:hypothetical protein
VDEPDLKLITGSVSAANEDRPTQQSRCAVHSPTGSPGLSTNRSKSLHNVDAAVDAARHLRAQ